MASQRGGAGSHQVGVVEGLALQGVGQGLEAGGRGAELGRLARAHGREQQAAEHEAEGGPRPPRTRRRRW